MIQLRSIPFLLLLAFGESAWAQDGTAEAYFNQASREYIRQDKMQALRTLDHGLQKFPGDPKLLKLAEELVKEEQKKQDQQQQQNKDQQQQDQQDKEKGNESEQKDQQQKDQQQKDQQQKDEQPQQANEQDQQQGKGEPQPNGIAPQDAMRMLDALERSEKDVQDKVRAKRRPAVRRTIDKDW